MNIALTSTLNIMNKYNIHIAESSYKKIQKKLQQYEIKIGGMSIRNFLIANSIVDDSKNPPLIRIKRIILHIAGDFDNRPEDLQNDVKLETNLHFGYNEFALLRKRLDLLVKEYQKGSKISAKEVHDCKTVNDCVDLLLSKINRSK